MEYWTTSPINTAPPRFRYPTWGEFINTVNTQFRDPAVEEVHEHKMFDLRMGNNPATKYFQKLEEEAIQAGRRNKTGPRDLMVRAIRLRVPSDYTSFIANHGENIPTDYDSWKARICAMYEERQKNSSSGKPMSNAPPRDSQGRWHTIKQTTYKGAGEPMNIDVAKLRAEGRCFRCHKKGHMGKDCPQKRDFKDIHSVITAEQEQTKEKDASSVKIEEVKGVAV
ncbi:hypothetical protein ARMSODRAFT_895266 [Armillaria solidipes]|uniref:CCHC-type domain-containing protein n=1 Tax=Armillaria solidipes TaxID=1076256 RepID=A0A2H3B9U7_9AGAR|nr:hypothetical protein ARMSODRAFT_895266 [Armillaria solidipes]